LGEWKGLSQNQNYTNAVGVVSRVTTNQLVLLQFRYIFISRELNLLVFLTFFFIVSCYYSRLLKLLLNFISNFKSYSNNLRFKISCKILFKTSFKILLKYLVNLSLCHLHILLTIVNQVKHFYKLLKSLVNHSLPLTYAS